MEGFKHTPGPWKYTISPRGRKQISDENGGQVCMLWNRAYAETELNGHLIANAPGMLDALIACAEREINSIGGIHPKTVDAIEKATRMKIKDVLEATARQEAER